MDCLLNPRSRRKHFAQVTSPARGIVAGPIAPYRRPIEYAFDAAPHPIRRIGLIVPDRLDHLQYEAGVDCCNGKLADFRIGVGLERREKLRPVLRVLPPALVGVKVGLSSLLEGDGPCGLSSALAAAAALRTSRVRQRGPGS